MRNLQHWHSEESERIDLVDDLAFLCFLYSDVSDEATITICMIEAARVRAAAAATVSATTTSEKLNGVEDNGRLTMNIRLNVCSIIYQFPSIICFCYNFRHISNFSTVGKLTS